MFCVRFTLIRIGLRLWLATIPLRLTTLAMR